MAQITIVPLSIRNPHVIKVITFIMLAPISNVTGQMVIVIMVKNVKNRKLSIKLAVKEY